MSEENYYKILDVDKTASVDEIKKAYRKMALKYHPDRNAGDKGAEEKFKKISEAYAVLSDPEKRKQYDSFGSQAFSQKFTQEDIFRNVDLNEILRDLGFGGFGGGFSQTRTFGRGGTGGTPFAEFFGGQQHYNQPRAQKGRDLKYNLSITLEEVFFGTEKKISLKGGEKSSKINMKIPAGVATGQKLRVAGKGLPGTNGGPSGDLFININVISHPAFTREENDIYADKSINFSEAVLGTSLNVKTLGGEIKRIKIPKGTQNGTKIRMKGYGLPYFKKTGYGDQYVRIRVTVPKKLTEKQAELIEKLSHEGL